MTDQKDKPDKQSFLEAVRLAAQTAESLGHPLSKEEAASFFKGMELSDEQQELVYAYLKDPDTYKKNSADSRTQILYSDFSSQTGQEPEKQAERFSDNRNESLYEGIPDTSFFRMYVEDLKKIVPYTPQEEAELYKQLIDGDKEALHKLACSWQLWVLEAAKKYAPPSKELADVIQEGNMGIFLELNNMLGSKKSIDFQMALKRAAREAMENYLLCAAAAKDLDHSLLAKASFVYESEKFLAKELLRMPTMEELSQYTKLPQEELESILALSKEKR